MSHAKEIKQKQELQARFQLAVSSTQNHVANWLNTSNSTISSSSSSSNNDFFNLPIISGGSGLSLSSLTSDKSSDDINTIGEYIKTGKSVSSLNKKKQLNSKSKLLNMNKVNIQNDSKALNALRNKMKNSNRSKHNQQIRQVPTSLNKKSSNSNNNDDSDSDDDMIQKAAPKKKFNLLIDSKIKKRK
ncbi:hypothetical protein BN7_4358 [Wickerhamomyces ciferrii]|uniref:Uncharacterized protein n=1 Tax=Wickerhamomyces ciferrii (strain ATCC 14091 / BCRC 22168 / CBS 111 / JCM 3599 / NBRC 0793 / NRRL Y-1031 F-60-10) TaxID=1206466 RepID=K0KHX3_WICCF|nr:uncharacterized protein BN7_4358 [Wickerhamomyces ciferrii]CCH44790.1 hypothetical protein BN7_4358 [Wickerhamomyces ciferrii]